MTLGAWMRNYLYIPLGGNKVNTKRRLYFNLWFVFLASGLWHGASWSFVIWGAYHGAFLVLERAGLLKFYARIGKVCSVFITFLIVLTGWVFFRVEDIGDALLFIKKMYVWNSAGLSVTLQPEFSITFLVAVFFSFFAFPKIGEKIQNAIYYNDYSMSRYFSMTLISLFLFFISLSAITASGFNPFIYFRF